VSYRYRTPNPTRLVTRRIAAGLKRLREFMLTQEGGNLSDGTREMFKMFEKVLPRLGKPSFDPEFLVTDGDPDPAAWNRNMRGIEDDLRGLYEEYDALRQISQEVSTKASVDAAELEEMGNLANSMITDLRLLEGQLGQDIIVAGDDFTDRTKVDDNFPTQFPKAEVNTLQGAVTLRRLEATNVITEDADIQVTPIGPSELLARAGRGRHPTPDGTMRFYEGKFYAPVGESRPEGGKWHMEERVRPGVTVPGDSVIYTLGSSSNPLAIFDEFPDLRREADTRPTGFPLRPEDIIIIDRGANLAELLGIRQRMIDGNPDSFWECEFLIDAPELDQLIEAREDQRDPAEGAADDEEIFTEVTPEELRARAAAPDLDRFDFDVEIVISLSRRQLVNFITMNPMNFKETAWLEIVDVSTADRGGVFTPIEGFSEALFDNVLTDQANAELTASEEETLLAQSKFSYRGQGVYTFAPRQVTKVRFRLKQRTPVPANYERIALQLTRTLSSSESHYSGSGGMGI